MFPNKFAIAIARKHNLYVSGNPVRMSPSDKDYKKGVEFHLCLQEFQKFAVSSEFEDAKVAYIDIKLTKSQKSALEKIFKHTRIWVRGEVVSELLVNMDTDPKAMASIAEIVLEQTTSGEEHEDKDEGMIITLKHKKA